MSGSVYYFSDGEMVKIGYTEGSVRKRLTQVQTGNGRPVKILGVEPGDRSREARLHNHFSSSRGVGEWFYPTRELISRIQSVREANPRWGKDGQSEIGSLEDHFVLDNDHHRLQEAV